jgi:chorismate synthase
LQSGIEHGVTLGTPIGLLVRNEDQRPKDYSETDLYPRPSHADLTYLLKYDVKASSGGGRASARETIGLCRSTIPDIHILIVLILGRVAAGAIAEKYLREAYGVEIVAFVTSVGKIHMPYTQIRSQTTEDDDDDSAEEPLTSDFINLLDTINRAEVDKYPTRCPHPATSERMIKRIVRAKEAMDSIGGTVTCVIRNAPPGLGEPVFDKFEAMLAHAMLSIPATKAFEIGSGFKGTEIPGSKHNDPFIARADGSLGTSTNWSGGIQGGITNSENIYFRYVVSQFKNDILNASFFSVSASSPLQLSPKPKTLPSMMGRPEHWLPGDAMTHVLFQELYR